MRRYDDARTPGLVYPGRIDPSRINLLVMMVEGHEGLAVVRTKDPSLGSVEFLVSPSMQTYFEDLAAGLKSEIGLAIGQPDNGRGDKFESIG